MPSPIITHNFRHSVAQEFVDSFSDDDNSYYVFIGKVLPWANEASPDSGNTTIGAINDAWYCMTSAKRLYGDSIRLVIPRQEWEANVKYTPYDDADEDYFSNTSHLRYVLTGNNDVYKCIDNANNSNSTVEPTGTNNNNGFIKTPDGYVWKYMFRVASEPIDSPFSTDTLIPVPSSKFATTEVVEGTIDRIVVTNPGFGYNSANAGIDLAIVTITGDGTGAVATANVGLLGNVSSISVISQGSGYTWAEIAIAGGSGATARAVISPRFGHGSKPAEELNAKSALLAARIGLSDATEGGAFSIQNDFRQFGILKNPYKYGETTIANSNAVSQTVNITLVDDSNPEFAIDDYVYQTDSTGNTAFQGYIVDVGEVSNTSVIKVTQTKGTVQTGSLIYNENAVTSKRVQSYETPPFERYSGQILYFENIQKTQRHQYQSETFKILFDF
jgi:hypothetical protein